MYKIGIIGAGHMAESHLDTFNAHQECEILAIADLNENLAKERAEKYGIKTYYSDYKKLLENKEIDAVVIVTPTFTHKAIVTDALNAGKNVLCEKPPALTADEVAECEAVAQKSGKLLMFGFVCRFGNHIDYLKKYIDSGKLGRIVSSECVRTNRCVGTIGWFSNREKGGGVLKDTCIHEIDVAMYLMGYPKAKLVLANESFINSDLPEKRNLSGWRPYDSTKCNRTVESSIEGFITFENGASMRIKTAHILNSVNNYERYVDICGEKAGLRIEDVEGGERVRMVELADGYFADISPDFAMGGAFVNQINHFVDCLAGKTECMVKISEAFELMKIIDALYKSAETKLPVALD